jgi:hypothetical protein
MLRLQSGFLLPNMNLYVIGGVVVIALAVAGTLAYKFNVLKDDNIQLKIENKTLMEDNIKLLAINEQNVVIIEQMKVERKNADTVLAKLESQKEKDAAELSKLRSQIRKIVKADPSKDAIAAPILKQTILEIQNHYNSSETKENQQ